MCAVSCRGLVLRPRRVRQRVSVPCVHAPAVSVFDVNASGKAARLPLVPSRTVRIGNGGWKGAEGSDCAALKWRATGAACSLHGLMS